VHENRRSSTRHDVTLPVTLIVAGVAHESTIQNLSLGGALIALGQRLPMGERVQVSFRIPTQQEAVEVGGSIRWSAETGVGVQFDGLRARDVWSLNKYFESLAG
jgi:hypothetical protein